VGSIARNARQLLLNTLVAEPDALVVSFAVTVTQPVPAVVGVPVIWPEDEIDRPAGRPVAVYVNV
jgi:hypothetical protein